MNREGTKVVPQRNAQLRYKKLRNPQTGDALFCLWHFMADVTENIFKNF